MSSEGLQEEIPDPTTPIPAKSLGAMVWNSTERVTFLDILFMGINQRSSLFYSWAQKP